MPKPTPEPKLWKNIAAMLDEMDDRSLRGLVHDLYKLAPENRAFLAAWIGDEDASVELLDGYKAKITAQFVSRGRGGGPRLNGGCDLALCRRLIKEYRRVTTAPEMLGGFDIRGTIDLGGEVLQSEGLQDIFVARLDPEGAHLWSRSFGNGESNLGESVASDSAGNTIFIASSAGVIDFAPTARAITCAPSGETW